MEWVPLSPPPTYGHSMIAVSNRLYLYGGYALNGFYEGLANRLYILDTQTNRWTLGPKIPFNLVTISPFLAMANIDKTIYLSGSLGSPSLALYSLDTETLTWTMHSEVKGEVPPRLSNHGM
eukprot:756407-Hanusia_phi.AAC.1